MNIKMKIKKVSYKFKIKIQKKFKQNNMKTKKI